MTHMYRFASALALGGILALVLSSCATPEEIAAEEALRYDGAVCILRFPLPDTVPFEVVDTLEVETLGRGSDEEAYGLLAEDARTIGANAVMKAHTYGAFGLIMFAQTGADGIAVKVTAPDFDCEEEGGTRY